MVKLTVNNVKQLALTNGLQLTVVKDRCKYRLHSGDVTYHCVYLSQVVTTINKYEKSKTNHNIV